MKRLGTLMLLVLFTAMLAGPADAGPRPGEKVMVPATPGPKEESRRLLQKSMMRLGEAQQLLQQRGKLGKEARGDLARELKDVALDLKTVQINLRELTLDGVCAPVIEASIPGVSMVVVVPADPELPPELPLEPMGPEAVTRATFKALLGEIDGQAFSDDKLMIVRSAARNAFFSVAQVKNLLDAFVHSSDKLDLLRVVADRIVDRENIFTIYSSLVHSSDKDEAREILEGH